MQSIGSAEWIVVIVTAAVVAVAVILHYEVTAALNRRDVGKRLKQLDSG